MNLIYILKFVFGNKKKDILCQSKTVDSLSQQVTRPSAEPNRFHNKTTISLFLSNKND